MKEEEHSLGQASEDEPSRGGPGALFVRPSPLRLMETPPLLVDWKETLGFDPNQEEAAAEPASAADESAERIDFSLLNEIFDNFLEVTGLPIAVLDVNGLVLASSKWHRLCTAFHRAHPSTLAGCVKSDRTLARCMRDGNDSAIYRCANGLTDCATPIMIDGRRVADLFTGQFLLEMPDMDFFRAQQERHGFSAPDYFEALAEIPVVAREKVPAILRLLRSLAQQIAQQSLTNSRALAATKTLQTVVDTVPHYVFWKDRKSHYLGCNQAFAELAGGASPQDVAGKSDGDLPWRDFARLYVEGDSQVLQSGIAKRDIVEPMDRGDGEVRWVEMSKVPLVDAHGDIWGVLGVFQDVTDRELTQAALRVAKEDAERANLAKSRFLAAVSHDLRQPLAALSLYVASLRGKLPAGQEWLQASMGGCVAHLSEMLSNLLDLSRLDAGVIRPAPKAFDLDGMLGKIAASVSPEALAKNLRLRILSTGKIAYSDPALYQRILVNLIANAIRYTKHGGVLVGARRRDGRLWIEIWDTGIGIAQESLGEIFEEFRQLGNKERNVAKGSGLGLAIVSRTAALLGLQTRVRSMPGKGSMFAIELPVGQTRPSRARSAPIGKCARIGLVEDNLQVMEALAFALSDSGHDVVPAPSGEELLVQLGGQAPDVLISDYRLSNDEDGFAVIRKLRAEFGKEVPALIITGDTDPVIIRRMAKEGITVQHKPLDLDALKAKIAEMLGPVAIEGPAPV